MQTAEDVSAAIEEAIKGILYLSNEIVTVNHDFGYFSKDDAVEGNKDSNTGAVTFGDEYSAKYYLPEIEFGKAKRFDISTSISGEADFGTSSSSKYYRGGTFLPEGGTYFVMNPSGSFEFSSGGDFLFQVYTTVLVWGTPEAEASTSLYIARIA